MDKRRCDACGASFSPASKRQVICGTSPLCAEILRASAELGVSPLEYAKAHRIGRGAGQPAPLSSDAVTENVGSNDLKFVAWPDTHFPYEDPKAINLGLQVVKHIQPNVIMLMGDMLDASGFGRFPHSLVEPKSFLATEVDAWLAFAQRLREAAPNADVFYIEGNHEARIEKWGWSHPQLSGWKGLKLSSILELERFGFHKDVILETTLADGELMFTHGTHTGANKAGFAARFEMARYGTSGISGHTHRLATYYERTKSKLKVWVEAGHMSQWQPHYLKFFPNWQQGLVIGEAARDGNNFDVEAIPFRLTYRCRVGGREFSS